jgi:hypothetical protein
VTADGRPLAAASKAEPAAAVGLTTDRRRRPGPAAGRPVRATLHLPTALAFAAAGKGAGVYTGTVTCVLVPAYS